MADNRTIYLLKGTVPQDRLTSDQIRTSKHEQLTYRKYK